MAIVAGTLEFPINVNSSDISSGLSAAEKKVKGFGDKLSSWAVAKGQMLGNLIAKAGQSTVQFVKGAVEESKAFNKSMSQVAATLGKSTAEIQDLTKFARLMGSKTAFTATEAAEGLNYMALAGYDAEKSMRMLPTVLNLAAAGNMKLADASDMVTDAQSALGLSIEETETMVDQMAKTSSLTNTSVSQLGSAFLTIGGTAKKLKGGTAELSAMLGVLANNGIKGAEGGTALRNVLNGLSNPVGKAAKQLKRLKVDVYDKEGNLRSMADVLTDFNDKTQKMTTKKRTELFAKMFNIRDLKSIEALLSMTKQDWIDLTEKIEESEGAADKMAKTQLDNLAGDVTIFGSALSEAKLAIMDGLTPALRSFVKSGTYWLSDLTKNFKEKGFKGITETAEKAWKFFERKWTVRSKNPFARFVGYSMKALRTGFKWNDVKAALTNGWKVVTDAFDKLSGLVFGKKADGTTNWPTAEDMIERIKETWASVKKAFENLGSLVFGTKADGTTNWPTAEDIFEKVQEIWSEVLKKAEKLVPMMFGENSTISEALVNAIHFIQDFGDWITENWETVSEGIKMIGAAFAAWKIAGLAMSLSPITLILTAIGAIALIVVANWDKIKTKVQDVIKWLGEQKEAVKTWVQDNLVKPVQDFIAKVQAAKDKLIEVFVSWIAENAGTFISWVNDNLIKPISDFISKIQDAIAWVKKLFTAGTTEESGSGGKLSKAQAAALKDLWTSNESYKHQNPVVGDEVEQKLKQGQHDLLDENFRNALSDRLRESGANETDINNALKELESIDSSGIDEFLESLTEATTEAETAGEKGQQAGENTSKGFDAAKLSAENATGAVEALSQAIAKLRGKTVLINVKTIGGGASPVPFDSANLNVTAGLPQFAKGEPTVPFDNYLALLHRGEAVLTKSQARQYREASNNIDISGMAASIVAAVREGMAGAQVNSFLSGKKVTDDSNRRTSNMLRSRRFATL